MERNDAGMNAATGKRSAVGAVALSVAALLFAPRAAADDNDDAFLAALTGAGIVINDRDSAIATGHMVCDGLQKGQSRSNLVLSTMKGTNLSPRSAGFIIGAAVASYCPQFSISGNSPSQPDA